MFAISRSQRGFSLIELLMIVAVAGTLMAIGLPALLDLSEGTKLNTAVVMWSVQQGVGKTLIGDTIGRLYGDNFRTISAVELHDRRNEWAKGCQFVLGEENASSDHRADANMLKHFITGETIINATARRIVR